MKLIDIVESSNGIMRVVNDIRKSRWEETQAKIASGELCYFGGRTIYHAAEFFDTDKFRGQREYQRETTPDQFEQAYQRYLAWKAAQ